MQFISAPEVSQQILFWLFGSLNKATWQSLIIIIIVTTICVALLSKELWKLTALRLGEDRAASLGINLQVLRIKVLVLVAMMTATAISFVGVIGFIGLVAPHVARMLLGEDQTFLLTGRNVSWCGILIPLFGIIQSHYPWCIVPSGDCYLVYWGAFLLLDYFK